MAERQSASAWDAQPFPLGVVAPVAGAHAYAEVMSASSSDQRPADGRLLLRSMLDRIRDDGSLVEFVGPRVDAERAASVLRPLSRPGSLIEWIAVNGHRVDAVVTAGDDQWRVVLMCSSATVVESLDVFERPARFDGVDGGFAVVINGPSGAGKSMLLIALQRLAAMPLVIFDEPEHIGSVQTEYLIWRDRAPCLHRGYLDAIAALARAGNHVATPAAGHNQAEFVAALGDVPTLTVGLTCALDVLIERERRTGRWGGIAIDSPAIHEGWIYDMEFETTNSPDPFVVAQQVLDRIDPGVRD